MLRTSYMWQSRDLNYPQPCDFPFDFSLHLPQEGVPSLKKSFVATALKDLRDFLEPLGEGVQVGPPPPAGSFGVESQGCGRIPPKCTLTKWLQGTPPIPRLFVCSEKALLGERAAPG